MQQQMPSINPSENDLTTNLELMKSKVLSLLDCINIGKVLEYYPDTQTADVLPMQVKFFMGQYKEPPILQNIPVIVLGTPNSYISFPDLKESYCIILSCDRNISDFLVTGETYTPSTSRMHNITDSIALCGFSPLNKSIQNYDKEAINIFHKIIDTALAAIYTGFFKNSGKRVQISSMQEPTEPVEGQEPPTEPVTASSSSITVTPSTVNILSGGTVTITSNGLINISNSTQNLLQILTQFINACINIQDTGGDVLSDPSKQAFNDVLTSLQELLS